MISSMCVYLSSTAASANVASSGRIHAISETALRAVKARPRGSLFIFAFSGKCDDERNHVDSGQKRQRYSWEWCTSSPVCNGTLRQQYGRVNYTIGYCRLPPGVRSEASVGTWGAATERGGRR